MADDGFIVRIDEPLAGDMKAAKARGAGRNLRAKCC